ncbi:hypothetical protein [Heyndrickxia ginsengihumi]|uniref:hypothetical protein n=1 Tax=Heyndrickxia ginsengihumi TaxID=363870 RepID=UPI0006922190|nr:hypothetical protein [Heyndrickxia ginsengihumi]
MGQLIKVQDFISRYEVDLNRYTNQFVRLKKQQWQLLKLNWQNKEFIQAVDEAEYVENESVLKKVKNWFKKRDDHPYEEEDEKTSIDSSFEFSPQLKYYPDTEEQLKQVFLDQLLKFQLRWASSTLQYMSDVPANMYFDEKLKYFLQRFPDTFLLMYKPVFTFKKASIEMDVILISPLRIWCLTFLEEEKDAVFIGSKEHFWQKRYQHGEKKY